MNTIFAYAVWYGILLLRLFAGALVICDAIALYSQRKYFHFACDLMVVVYVLVPFIKQIWEGSPL